jgi:ATP-dependent DNA helicase PIF1
MSKDIFYLIDKLLKKLMKTDQLFGGKIMICSGDFRQTLPVIEGVNSEIAITGNSLLNSPLFTENFKRMRLTRNMRASA